MSHFIQPALDALAEREATLEALQAGGSKPPFFAVFGPGGTTRFKRDLARYLGPDQPFYGLPAQDADPKQPWGTRVEDMAARHVQEIRTLQPEGPYFLSGFCLGGVVAFEMAQQLGAYGQQVALLALFDAHEPGYQPPGRKFRLRARVGATRTVSGRQTCSAVCRAHRGSPPSLPQAPLDLKEASLQAFRQYVPKALPGLLTLLCTRHLPWHRDGELQSGWAPLAGGGLELYEIPCVHQAIVEDGNVRILAALLRMCLCQARREDLRTAFGSSETDQALRSALEAWHSGARAHKAACRPRQKESRGRKQEWKQRVKQAAAEIAHLIPLGEPFILVDQDEWGTDKLVAGRPRIPFLERDGQYWGPPPNDTVAVAKLERLRQSGVGFIAFAWPAFWWLDCYSGLHQHLRSRFRCLLENDRLVVFDLRTCGAVFEERTR